MPSIAAPTVRWNRPEQSSDLLTALGATITDDADLTVASRPLVSLAADAIDGASSCGVTVAVAERTFTAVHSDVRTLIVDSDQYQAGDGPCLHAARTGEVVRVDVIASDRRWPDFAASARQENIYSFLAAPLYSSHTRFGSLILYGERPSAFDDRDVAIATALTDALAHALGDYERFDDMRTENTGLRTAMSHRAPIEQAKGMLMAIHRTDVDAAFDMLTELLQSRDVKIRDLAVHLVADCSVPHDRRTQTHSTGK
ncbi:GAF and ANTAR domain-containing protein [Rhodococcus sp. IEGM1428]|uniref:GAF and ANTAR domain-containing protein n=1 Tax=Rhodococcus sp. IEGM1428 TaxID=3392191 RepID=UPI003D0EEAE3